MKDEICAYCGFTDYYNLEQKGTVKEVKNNTTFMSLYFRYRLHSEQETFPKRKIISSIHLVTMWLWPAALSLTVTPQRLGQQKVPGRCYQRQSERGSAKFIGAAGSWESSRK